MTNHRTRADAVSLFSGLGDTKPMRFTLGVVIAASCAGLMVGQNQRNSEVQLRAAEHVETVQGNIKAAIEEYKKLARSPERGIAAKALVRLGRSYERIGHAEAQSTYERVLRDFADQPEQAAEARQRLASIERPASPATGGVVSRQVWTGSKVETGGTVSPDGRYLSYTDWSTGNRAVHDLTEHTDRRLTDKGTFKHSRAYAEQSAISRDGESVAYAWYDDVKDTYQLRLISLQSQSHAAERTIYDNPDVRWLAPHDWSPDGKTIALQMRRIDGVGSIALVSAVDGRAKVLKTIEWRGTSKIAFSPDGKFLAYDLPATSSSPQRDVFVIAVDGSRETPTVVHPADDRVVGWSPDGKTLLFSSSRSGAAGLWGVPMVTGKGSGPAILIKNDLGHGRALGVTASGSLYFGSKIAGPDIHVVSVDFTTGQMLAPPVNPVPVYTGSNQHPHWSPDGKFLAYISRRDTGGLNNVLCILSRETGEVREMRTEMAYVNRPRWSPDGRSLAVMGTDLKGRDGLFRIDVQTGGLSPLVFNEPRLNSNVIDWSRDGKRIFLTRAAPDKGWVFVERDVVSGAERIIAHRKDMLYGLAALSPDGKWFAMRAEDAASKESLLVVMDVVDGETRELLRAPKGVGVAGWTPDSTSVIVNKSEKGNPETWRVPLSGAAPTKLGFRVSSPGTPFSLHPDGRQIAYWTAGNVVEVWAIDNFLQVATAHR